MVDRFVVGCYGVVFNAGNLLMVKPRTGLWANKWVLPGGMLSVGDTPESCTVRKIFEKTSCRVQVSSQIKVIIYSAGGSIVERQILLIFYLCKFLEGTPRPGDGIQSTIWTDRINYLQLAGADAVPLHIQSIINDLRTSAQEFFESPVVPSYANLDVSCVNTW